MSLYPLCAVCAKPAFYACRSCGRSVCDGHYNPKYGLCSACEGGRLVELPPT
ncbi:MAG TPA: hypothetical protein VI915_03110 [Thermoplasmata archaeon]|nr:hypothetical protein [Thermoplasmata archaeon]